MNEWMHFFLKYGNDKPTKWILTKFLEKETFFITFFPYKFYCNAEHPQHQPTSTTATRENIIIQSI